MKRRGTGTLAVTLLTYNGHPAGSRDTLPAPNFRSRFLNSFHCVRPKELLTAIRAFIKLQMPRNVRFALEIPPIIFPHQVNFTASTGWTRRDLHSGHLPGVARRSYPQFPHNPAASFSFSTTPPSTLQADQQHRNQHPIRIRHSITGHGALRESSCARPMRLYFCAHEYIAPRLLDALDCE